MRVAIAGQTYFPSSNGQAVFTVQLAEGLAALGHHVLVIVPSDRGRPYSVVQGTLRVEKVRALQLGANLPDVYLNLPADLTVSHLLRAFEPDIVHIQDHYPLCRAAVFSARRQHVPLVGTNHFLPENVLHYLGLPAWVNRRLERVAWFWVLELYNRLGVVTTPTETAAAILRRQPVRPPVYPISCGVDPTRFHPDPNVDRDALCRRYGLDASRALFLFVGRMDQEKRIDVLLQAMARLQRDDMQLVLAGHGRYTRALLALAEQLGLGRRAVFTGYIPAEDLPALLNSVDVFTMPSEAELQSIATLEAMACGKPVLAANARALPELVKDGVNGHLFVPGDDEDAARVITQMMDERACWPEMAVASLARVADHSLGNTVARYEQLYSTLSPGALPLLSLAAREPAGEHTW